CAEPCSCTVGMKRIPAAGKRSSASMYAETTRPNTFCPPCGTRVSTNASEGVMRCLPVTAMRFTSAISVMGFSFGGCGESLSYPEVDSFQIPINFLRYAAQGRQRPRDPEGDLGARG